MRTQPPEQNPNDYDEVTRLRLQLAHAETQRDAYAAALKTDVLKIAKVAIYQAAIDAGKDADADTIGCMGVELDDVKAENSKLKAEVERLRFAEDLLKDENQHLHKEQPLPDGWNSAVAKACDLLAEKEKEIARLKAEVERLKHRVDRLKVFGEDLAHAVRTKRSVDFALEEWDRLVAEEGGAK